MLRNVLLQNTATHFILFLMTVYLESMRLWQSIQLLFLIIMLSPHKIMGFEIYVTNRPLYNTQSMQGGYSN